MKDIIKQFSGLIGELNIHLSLRIQPVDATS